MAHWGARRRSRGGSPVNRWMTMPGGRRSRTSQTVSTYSVISIGRYCPWRYMSPSTVCLRTYVRWILIPSRGSAAIAWAVASISVLVSPGRPSMAWAQVWKGFHRGVGVGIPLEVGQEPFRLVSSAQIRLPPLELLGDAQGTQRGVAGALVAEDAATDRFAPVQIRAGEVRIQRDLVDPAAESALQEAAKVGVALGLRW